MRIARPSLSAGRRVRRARRLRLGAVARASAARPTKCARRSSRCCRRASPTAPAGRSTSTPRSRALRHRAEQRATSARCSPSPSRSRPSAPTRRCPASARSRARRSTAAPSVPASRSCSSRRRCSCARPTAGRYSERIDAAKTEQELSDIFEDFIGHGAARPALLRRLQPGAHRRADAGQHRVRRDAGRSAQPYPYPDGRDRSATRCSRAAAACTSASRTCSTIRRTTTSRSIASPTSTPASYASRNAAFQNAVSVASGMPLDARRRPRRATAATRQAGQHRGGACARSAPRLELERGDDPPRLEHGNGADFEQTRLYARVFELAEQAGSGRCRARAAAHRAAEPEDHAAADHRVVRAPRRRALPALPRQRAASGASRRGGASRTGDVDRVGRASATACGSGRAVSTTSSASPAPRSRSPAARTPARAASDAGAGASGPVTRDDRRLQRVERLLREDRRDLGADAAEPARLVHDDRAAGLAHRGAASSPRRAA